MVYNLTSNRIFRSPLAIQSFAFFCTTHRAVSLLAVEFIKRMPVFTVSLPSIDCTNSPTVQSIFFWCKQSQVIWSNAISIPANMINNHTLWYVTYGKIVGDAVCSPSLTSKIKGAVPVFIKKTLPKITTLFFYPPIIKSFVFFSRVSFHNLLPLSPLTPFNISYV
jgi:hypothetical protein